MVRTRIRPPGIWSAAAALLLLALATLWGVAFGLAPGGENAAAHAERQVAYDLWWWTVDGGGSSPGAGPVYTLGGTAGQPDAAAWEGTGYTLLGGFWTSVWRGHRIYLPLVLRNG